MCIENLLDLITRTALHSHLTVLVLRILQLLSSFHQYESKLIATLRPHLRVEHIPVGQWYTNAIETVSSICFSQLFFSSVK